MTNLVSTDELARHLGQVVVLDATWHLPNVKRDARAEFVAAHIPGARFFDLDRSSDQSSPLPHMMPPPAQFAAQMAALGISDDTQVVAYDSYGMFSAARCWFMFKAFGHDKVAVLNGGLRKWLAEGRAVESGDPLPATPGKLAAQLNPKMLRTLNDVAAITMRGGTQIADARSPGRFRGEEPEPRPGVRPGHIPAARCVHYASLLNGDGTMKSRVELARIFADAGIDITKPVITSCGSGVTAAILSLALTELRAPDHGLYDGSWAEWGASEQPLATGA